MPGPSNRRGPAEKNRRARLGEKSSSFHSHAAMTDHGAFQLRRPKTLPELLPSRVAAAGLMAGEAALRPEKVLMKVTVQGSVGAVQVLTRRDSSVGELIVAVLSQYAKEARRPILPPAGAALFNLHYSQFALECLDREEKLTELGSRNFFMCLARAGPAPSPSASTCATQADQVANTKPPFAWLKFMDFML